MTVTQLLSPLPNAFTVGSLSLCLQVGIPSQNGILLTVCFRYVEKDICGHLLSARLSLVLRHLVKLVHEQRCSGSLPKTGARYIERGAHSMLPRARGEKFSGVFQMVVELLARPDVVVWRAAV